MKGHRFGLVKIALITAIASVFSVGIAVAHAHSGHHQHAQPDDKQAAKPKRSPARVAHSTRKPARVRHSTRKPARLTHSKRKPAKLTHTKRRPAQLKHSKGKPARLTHSKRKPARLRHSKNKPASLTHATRTTYGELKPLAPNGPRGIVVVSQRGRHLSAQLFVYGLLPLSVHPAHIHGPNGSCQKYADRHAAEFMTFTANANGIGETRLNPEPVDEQIVGRRGYFVLVHRDPPAPGGHSHSHSHSHSQALTAPANPALACADLRVQ